MKTQRAHFQPFPPPLPSRSAKPLAPFRGVFASLACPWKIFFLQNPKSDNLNGMEKPPFQFGLKAVFVAMTLAAVLIAVARLVSPEAGKVVAGMLAFLALLEGVNLYMPGPKR